MQRAANTAEAVRAAQSSPVPREVTKLLLLREQDFGFYEAKTYAERPREPNAMSAAHRSHPDFRDVESKDSMMTRADTFIDAHLLQLLEVEEHSVVVVAHGIILNYLWRGILKRFPSGNVAVVASADRGVGLEYLGGWSNTGVLDLEVKPKAGSAIAEKENATSVPVAPAPTFSTSEAGPSELPTATTSLTTVPPVSHPMLRHLSLVVKAVNNLEHLNGLKKTRGGIGSLKHDPSQKTMDSFFKKRRIE